MTRLARGTIVAILAAGFALCLTWSSATADGATVRLDNNYDDQIAEAEKKKAELKDQQEELDQALEDTSADLVKANQRLRDLNARLPEAQKELDLAEERLWHANLELEIAQNKLSAAEDEDARITAQIEADTARQEELRTLVAELARSQYRGEDSSATLRLIFGSATTDDFLSEFTFQHTVERTQGNALAEIDQIAAANRNRGVRQDAVRAYAEELRQDAAKLVKRAERARKVADAKRAEIEAGLAEQAKLKAYLQDQKASFLADIKANKKEQIQTEFELIKLARQAKKDDLKFPAGDFQSPVPKPSWVTSHFGYRMHPIFHIRLFHTGVDLHAPCGVPIRASTWGVVVHAELTGGHGNQVLLNHGIIKGHAYTSTYNHFSRFAVKKGDVVAPGDVVGYAGTTGNSIGCHLHFEITRDGHYVDPMNYIHLG